MTVEHRRAADDGERVPRERARERGVVVAAVAAAPGEQCAEQRGEDAVEGVGRRRQDRRRARGDDRVAAEIARGSRAAAAAAAAARGGGGVVENAEGDEQRV